MNSGLQFAILLALLTFFIPPKYEYTWVRFTPKDFISLSRTGDGAAKSTAIEIDETKLKEYGKNGWEVCGVFLEPETSYPNFGNESYVTGLQPNFRAQSAVILLKRTKAGLNAMLFH
jgi:hypothetical protein